MRSVYDRHTLGLFSRADWFRILSEVGYKVDTLKLKSLENYEGGTYYEELFLCCRPVTS